MAISAVHTAEWPARLERMVDHYRAVTNRRRLKLAMKVWRLHEARQVLADLERPPARIH
jgi:hypothetical protein